MQISLKELQSLRDAQLPEHLSITPQELIINVKQMVETHLQYLEANSGNAIYLPYYERLCLVYRKVKGI